MSTATKTLSRQSLWSVRAHTHRNTKRTMSGTHSFKCRTQARTERARAVRHETLHRTCAAVSVKKQVFVSSFPFFLLGCSFVVVLLPVTPLRTGCRCRFLLCHDSPQPCTRSPVRRTGSWRWGWLLYRGEDRRIPLHLFVCLFLSFSVFVMVMEY